MVSKHAALIYAMMIMSIADEDMSDPELDRIVRTVRYLPAFRDFDVNELQAITRTCESLLQTEDGIDTAIALMRDSLSPNLRETAYALACDVAAADDVATQEELRLLEMMRDGLAIDSIVASGIERGARARHATS